MSSAWIEMNGSRPAPRRRRSRSRRADPAEPRSRPGTSTAAAITANATGLEPRTMVPRRLVLEPDHRPHWRTPHAVREHDRERGGEQHDGVEGTAPSSSTVSANPTRAIGGWPERAPGADRERVRRERSRSSTAVTASIRGGSGCGRHAHARLLPTNSSERPTARSVRIEGTPYQAVCGRTIQVIANARPTRLAIVASSSPRRSNRPRSSPTRAPRPRARAWPPGR